MGKSLVSCFFWDTVYIVPFPPIPLSLQATFTVTVKTIVGLATLPVEKVYLAVWADNFRKKSRMFSNSDIPISTHSRNVILVHTPIPKWMVPFPFPWKSSGHRLDVDVCDINRYTDGWIYRNAVYRVEYCGPLAATCNIGVDIGATWWIQLNDPCATAMRSYVKLLWPLVSVCCTLADR